MPAPGGGGGGFQGGFGGGGFPSGAGGSGFGGGGFGGGGFGGGAAGGGGRDQDGAMRHEKGNGRRKAWDVSSTVIRMLEVRKRPSPVATPLP